jgi:hypothetical protein
MSEGNFKDKTNWPKVPDWRLTPRQTGRLTVGRKLTSTSTSEVSLMQPYGSGIDVHSLSDKVWDIPRFNNVHSAIKN